MKRVLALLLALVMALSLVSVVYAEPCAEDAHVWVDGEVTQAPTCGTKGTKKITCSACGTEDTAPVAATGAHTVTTWNVTTQPSCEGKGVESGTCTVCNSSITRETNAKGHQWDSGTTTAATCEVDGKIVYKCTVTGCSGSKEDKIPATGHTKVETITKKATCKEEGLKTITCSVEGCTYKEENVKIPKLTEHTWDEGTITKEPTCVEEGEKTFKCTVCGTEKEEKEKIEKLKEHKWEKNGTVTTAPTCVKKGVRTFKCEVEKCPETKTEEIAMVNHSWDNGTTTIEATVTEEGLSTFKCIVCGKTQTQTIPRLGESMDPDELATLKAAPNNAYGAKLNVEPWVMVQAVLDQEELTRVQGGWPFSVTLGVKNISSQVSDGDRQLFMDHIADEQIIVAFLDVTLIKQMHGDPAQPVDATAEMVDIALDMPEGLPALKKNMTRSFMVLRLHDGVVEGVPTKLSEDGEQIIFQTDKFSTYLLTYSDVREESSFPILPVFIALMVVALAGVVYLCKMIFIDRIFDNDDDDDDDDYDDYEEYEEYEEPKRSPKQSGRRLHTEKRRKK